jgi:hypothetical protein
MSQWNQNQYNQYPQQYPPQSSYTPGYQPPGPYPGPSPNYGQPQYASVNDSKNPYEGDRFKPKKKLNDPIFLILFILQV